MRLLVKESAGIVKSIARVYARRPLLVMYRVWFPSEVYSHAVVGMFRSKNWKVVSLLLNVE